MERTEDLNDFAHACWKDVFLEIRDAAVYIDHAAAECLHWYTGDKAHLSLKNAGAISVHELSLFNLQVVKNIFRLLQHVLHFYCQVQILNIILYFTVCKSKGNQKGSRYFYFCRVVLLQTDSENYFRKEQFF